MTRVVPKELLEALGRGVVVVTGNGRAARSLRRAYDEMLQTGGENRWEPASVMSWSTWTASLWRRMLIEGRTSALLLNPFQEHSVWRGVLAEDQDARGLRGADRLAEMAAETWARLCAYARGARTPGGKLRAIYAPLSEENRGTDTAAFARWARVFEERCEAEGLLTVAGLPAALAEAVGRGELRLGAGDLLLVGFDAITPAQERLLGALRSAGVTVSHAPGGVAGPQRLLTAAADDVEELRVCARWAAARIDRDHGGRIAVIVPDVAAERASIERVFREVLAPELESIAANEATAPYEFSLGRTLAEIPMVSAALELLRWAAGALPLDRASALLLSDYFAGVNSAAQGSEREARAEFDAFELRRARMLRPEITVTNTARRLAGSKRSTRLPGTLRALRRMEGMAAEFNGIAQSHGEWAQRMRDLLAGSGWGAAGVETSEEFQVRVRWESALDAMSTLDFRGQAVEYADALGAIERIAQKTLFAPQSRSAPVQVMGPLEAAGSEFDAVWFLRAGELSWPPVAGTLPLLPWGLQRDLGMPGTEVARDLDHARRVTERIVASGREVVVSYARVSGDVQQRAAAMVHCLTSAEVEVGDLAGVEPDRKPVPVELVEDAGQIRPLPDSVVSGGVRVLELQAACGFRAFAEQRLWSSEMEGRPLGLSAKESGTAVHAALECFWTEVGSQAALVAMNVEEQRAALARAIDKALGRAESTSDGAWDEAYLRTQRERLGRLLERWLEVEKTRPAFAVIQQEEKLRDVRVGPLRFELRVDRVDVVDEAQVLIDYKTGAARSADWLGERPDAPQVPLYAILADRGFEDAKALRDPEDGFGSVELGPVELGGVAFGSVRAGDGARLHGFAARDGLLPGRLTRMQAGTFGAQVDRWRDVLERLAEEFAGGDARVRPKNYPSTCLRCGQRMLCRLDASLLEEMDEEEVPEGPLG